jgi:hypothetical protein
MDVVQLATAVVSLFAAILSLVAVKRAGTILKSQEVGRGAKSEGNQTIIARQ